MSRTPAIELRRLEMEEHPASEVVIARANELLVRTGRSPAQLADLIGVGESTLKIYLRGDYASHPGMQSTQYMDARVWSYLARYWPKENQPEPLPLVETKGYFKILKCIEEAVESGAISVVYGPPSSEKSFVAEQLVAQYRHAGRRDLLRIICDPRSTPLSLLKDVAREAGVWIRGNNCRIFRDALVEEFLSHDRPPAIILDEAQHLDTDCFETLRIALHERTRRGGEKGCGLVVMGSHNLYRWFIEHARGLEQWLSRISYRVQLEGMSREEALDIAARALGVNGKKAQLTPAIEERLLNSCRVLDRYATNPDGKPLHDAGGKPIVRTYYSSRRLMENIRQSRRKDLSAILEARTCDCEK